MAFKRNVLIIGDTHEPFCHPLYRNFCLEVANKFQCSEVVHIGDEVDNHAISYHESKPDGHGAYADWLRSDGKNDVSLQEEAFAQNLLDQELGGVGSVSDGHGGL